MSRAERNEQIMALRRVGGTVNSIARDLGISTSRVSDAWCDPDGSKSRDRKDRYRGMCEACGEPTCGGDGRAKAPRFCAACAPLAYSHWTREVVIAAIQEFARRYGRPPTSTDWNPSHPHASREQRERFYRDGCWPRSFTPQYRFGSWANAIEASGFPRPDAGPRKRARVAA